MKLTYLTDGLGPEARFAELFSDVRVVGVDRSELPHRMVGKVEEKMRDAGSNPFDPDDFVVVTKSIERLGEVVARNRLNYGVVEGFDDHSLELNGKSRKAHVKLGGEQVYISHAVRLPFDGPRRVLFVAPHFEEEATLFPAYLHKKAGDKVRYVTVTEIPKDRERPDLESITHGVYQGEIGLDQDEYEFLNLPDRLVTEHRREVEDAVMKNIIEFRPETLITIVKGSNFDHNAVADYSVPLAESMGLNVLLGDTLQNNRFRPRLWEVLDRDEVDTLVGTFAYDKIGMGRDHRFQIDNLFSKLPETLNRYVSLFRKEGEEGVGVYGLQPVNLTGPYQIRHATRLFN